MELLLAGLFNAQKQKTLSLKLEDVDSHLHSLALSIDAVKGQFHL